MGSRATLCYMEASRRKEQSNRIPHRELRNNSGEVIRRAQAGELLVITNNGEPVADLGPHSETPLESMRRRGKTIPAKASLADLKMPTRVLSRSSAEIVDDLRGPW